MKWQEWGKYARRCDNYSICKCKVNGQWQYELWSFKSYMERGREVITDQVPLAQRLSSFDDAVKILEGMK